LIVHGTIDQIAVQPVCRPFDSTFVDKKINTNFKSWRFEKHA